MKLNTRSVAKAAVYLAIAVGFFTMGAYAAEVGSPPPNSMGDIAGTLIDSLANVSKVMTAIAYLAGFGFAIASFFKLKQHKDNPQQIPVTNGITLLVVAVALIFLPSILQTGGSTLFRSGGETAGVTGITAIPGQDATGN